MRIGHAFDLVDNLEELIAMSTSPAPEVLKVEGRITFAGTKPRLDGSNGVGAMRLVTFSYSVEGQHFHKIHDIGTSPERRRIANAYKVGDKVEVWCLKSDPTVGGISEIPVHSLSAWDWISGVADFLNIFS
jgi:hypothetical protein